jgi:tetratricopeptide (TPR) repeat protein
MSMKYFLWLLFLLLPAISTAEEASTILADADAQYAKREEPGYVQKAIEEYNRALSMDPALYEAAWKLSKAEWYLGNHSPKEEKENVFQSGIDAAKKAIAIAPDKCEGHFWLGVNYGFYGEAHGMFKALGLINPIKEEMNKTMAINENCECGGPQRVLGRLYAKAPFFKGGSKSKAIEWLNKSMELCPNDTQTRMFLAEIYMDQNKKNLAIEQLKAILNVVPDPGWIPENKENKMLAEKMLAQLEKK